MACKYKSKVWFSGWCDVACVYCTLTQERNCEHNKETNADRIRAMSDEELEEFIKNIKVRAVFCKAIKNNDAFKELCSAEWLKQPAE